MPTIALAACRALGMSVRTGCGASVSNCGFTTKRRSEVAAFFVCAQTRTKSEWPLCTATLPEATLSTKREGLHAPHSERNPGRHADHLHRSRAGKAAGSAIVDDGAGTLHGAPAGLYLDQPAPQPRRAAHRQLRPMAKSRTPAGGSQITGLSQGLAQV